MLVFPNCKINIGLRVTAKRPDGFHDIETIFLPVPWHDALEIIEADSTTITTSGLEIPGETSKNLCIKAWHLLKNDFPDLPPVAIYLHKTIPTGAGLGGGSSNGAFMLKALNQKFGIDISFEKLIEYALKLGSDCPFFILNKPATGTGRGERLTPIELDLAGKYLVLENPGIHIPTSWAFGKLKTATAINSLKSIVEKPINTWEDNGLTNDFTHPVCQQYPKIKEIIQQLKDAGALFAEMTGTGSTCFGIFDKEPVIDNLPTDSSGLRKVILL
jgi:4-diphosphocytidyl-2-C-methyl-D-erythritol kinase